MIKAKNNPLNVEFSSYVEKAILGSAPAKVEKAFVFVLGLDDKKETLKILNKHAASWQLKTLKAQLNREVTHFSGKKGPVWIIARKLNKGPHAHYGRLEDSTYSWHRDQVGSLIGYTKAYQLKALELVFIATDEQQELGAFVGLDLASYTFKGQTHLPKLYVQKKLGKFDRRILKQAGQIAMATNVARHLVNTPPSHLNPTSFAEFVKKLFRKQRHIQVEVWSEKKLKAEKMGLHLGVGQGSLHPPCLVHLRYRPVKKVKKQKPYAFVGKGITFDTGGLDIKPSSNMRLMKKDMGGAASLVGLAYWLSFAECAVPVDIYLGLAENSVDAKSMRPSDVLQSRNGMTVEVHNTDAEGRLVLADALDVAVTQKGADEPQVVIDVATLTGAIKAGLGADISGLFANHDGVAEDLNRSGSKMGEPNWRMPLFQKYNRGMETPFADIVNCIDGFGGAITAALFLERFVKGKPWAHLDIYAWNDKPVGGLSFSGGSGQPVQTLIEYLKLKSLEDSETSKMIS